MKIIKKDEYVFQVDVEKTMNYYKTHSLCECDYCENFYAQIEGKFPKLETFLSEFGVDISKPDELSSLESDNEVKYITIDYTVCGKVINMGQYEIDIQDNQYFNLVIIDGYASPNEQTGEYFTISVNSIIDLPWVLKKPLSETIETKGFKNLFKRKNLI